MKKLVLVTMIILLVCGFAFASAAAESKADAPKELTVWFSKCFSDDVNNAIEARALAFGEANNVKMSVEYLKATDLTNTVNAALEAGSGNLPDVMMWSSYGKFMYYYPDLVNCEVTDLFNEINGAHPFLGQRSGDCLEIDGKQYAIPFSVSPILMYVRKDAMEAAGVTKVPETWEEVFDLAWKITEATDLNGLGWGCGPTYEDGELDVRNMMWTKGGFQLTSEGLSESPLYKEFAEEYVKMYNAGVIPTDATTWTPSGNNNSYLAEESGIVFNASTLSRSLKNDHKDLYEKTIIASVPAESEHLYDTTAAWTITNKCEDKELAKDFLRWMLDYDWYSEFIKVCAPVFAPIYEEIAASDFWTNDSDNAAVVAYSKKADAFHSFPSRDGKMIAAGMKIYQTYGWCNVLSSMINGSTFEEAWAVYDQSVKDILKETL